MGINCWLWVLRVVRVDQDWFIQICKGEHIDPPDRRLLARFEDVVGVHGCDRVDVVVYICCAKMEFCSTTEYSLGVIPILSKETAEGAWREDV
jgi:hypothetical protein